MSSRKLIRLTENDLHKIIKESVFGVLNELHHTTYQSASNQAFDNDDNRTYSFRKQAEKSFGDDISNKNFHFGQINNDVIKRNEENTNKWLQLNNNKKLVIFDDEYKDLNDLYNGVKCGKLLIHARGMLGDVTDDMKYIEPCFSETLLQYYGGEYESVYDSKKEYYGDNFEDDGIKYPELIFASDDFSWTSKERNGVFFIESDGFQKSLGNGMIQLPNGTICKYYEGEVYDYDNELLRDEPICCEYGDWYSSNLARVVAVMDIK